jgi:hypothetical protein
MITLAERSCLSPRIGRSRDFSRPWSHSTPLLAVGIAVGAMPGCWRQVLEHDRIGRGPVGDHLSGCHLRRADGLLEEPGGRLGDPPRGHEHVDDLACLVDHTVDVAPLAGDLDVGLVHEPSLPDDVAAWLGGIGQQRRDRSTHR